LLGGVALNLLIRSAYRG